MMIVLLITCVLYLSCEDMNSVHQEYLDRGEIIYAKKVDSVATYSGHNRAKFEIYLDTMIVSEVEFIGKTNSGINTGKIPVVQNMTDTGSFIFILNDLSEGENFLEVISYDFSGNPSLPVEVFVNSYGEYYKNGLINRSIHSQRINSGECEIRFNVPLENDLLTTSIEYTTTLGENVEVSIGANNNAYVVLPGYDTTKSSQYRSSYLPEPNAIDTFLSEYTSIAKESWN